MKFTSRTLPLFALVFSIACAGNEGAPCDPECASDMQTCCDGACVFTDYDFNNCGMCGRACSAGQTCREGSCTAATNNDSGTTTGECSPECSSGQRCCGRICVATEQPRGANGRPATPDDASSPFNNCNGCGLRCDPERASSCSLPMGATAGSRPSCLCGDMAECLPGDVCVPDGGGYTCVNTSTDVDNCGGVGIACADGEACMAGNCVCGSTGGRCGEGQGCCGGRCIDLTADADNCGECGNACGAEAPTCQDRECVCGTGPSARACAPITDSSTGESCCEGMCVANNDSNCGGCGRACDADMTCIVDPGLIPGGGGAPTVCCAPEDFPIFCIPDIGFPDGGFGFPDGGLPFP
jgi:hypothetical protein